MILNHKAPFIVTLLTAALAWSVTHIVDRLNNTPFLKYDLLIEDSRNIRRLRISLENITNDKVFRNLSIVASSPHDSAISRISIVPQEPAFEGDKPYSISESGRTAQIKLPVVQPGWSFDILVEYAGKNRPYLRIETKNDTVKLTRPNLETFLVENEFKVIVCLISIWLVTLAIIFWIMAIARKKNTNGKQIDHNDEKTTV